MIQDLSHPVHKSTCAQLRSRKYGDCDCGYAYEKGNAKPGDVIAVMGDGLRRVPNSVDGATFIVNSATEGLMGTVVHVRDYRYTEHGTRAFVIWSVGADGYRVVQRAMQQAIA